VRQGTCRESRGKAASAVVGRYQKTPRQTERLTIGRNIDDDG
jgi:hypothetical protein